MANKANHRRQGGRKTERPSSRDSMPSGCAGTGHNGAIGMSVWKKISRRKVRRHERDVAVEIAPHRKSRLRHYEA